MNPYFRRTAVLLAGLAWAALAPLAAQEPASPRLQLILRARMPASGQPPELTAGAETFPAAPGLPCFYGRRDHLPAWTGEQGPRRDADELLAALAEAPA